MLLFVIEVILVEVSALPVTSPVKAPSKVSATHVPRVNPLVVLTVVVGTA